MRTISKLAITATMIALAAPATASAQRTLELGIDAGAVIGLGDQSSINITLPASRFRLGYFMENARWSIEPAAGISYNKVEGVDGVWVYDLELGTLYHFRPLVLADDTGVVARLGAPYIRPFVGLTGFSGATSDSEVSLGTGIGVKAPWRDQLAWRLEANIGYGLDNEAARLGLLAGLSFFTR